VAVAGSDRDGEFDAAGGRTGDREVGAGDRPGGAGDARGGLAGWDAGGRTEERVDGFGAGSCVFQHAAGARGGGGGYEQDCDGV